MAQFDVHRLADGGLVVDCQADRFDGIGTRLCIPLMPSDYAPPPRERLNPRVAINGEELLVVTQFAQAMRTNELRGKVGSLAADRDAIIRSLDTLIGAGF